MRKRSADPVSNSLAAERRPGYDGPLAMAADITVFNVTKENIEVREVSFNHEAWAQGTSAEWDTAARRRRA